MHLFSGIIVFGSALFLIGLAALIVVAPRRAERFLRMFAGTARAHFTEHALRLLAGAALVVYSSAMWLADMWRIFGWFIVASSIILLCLPWRWHHRFAKWAIPLAIRILPVYAIGSLALGAFILWCMFR